MKKITFLLIFVLAFILLSSQAFGAAYIKFDSVDGEADDVNHQGWIEVHSFEHQKAGPNRRLEMLRVTLVKDGAATALASAYRNKKVFASVKIDDVSSPSAYYRYELTNVMVTSYQEPGANNQFDLVLNFEEIKVTYTKIDSAGKRKDTVKYEWKRGPKIL